MTTFTERLYEEAQDNLENPLYQAAQKLEALQEAVDIGLEYVPRCSYCESDDSDCSIPCFRQRMIRALKGSNECPDAAI